MDGKKSLARTGSAKVGVTNYWRNPFRYLWPLPLAFFAIFFFFPLAGIFSATLDLSLLGRSTLQGVWGVLSFTFYQAFLSTLITFLLGLPAAYLFARFTFPGKALLRALTAVPFMLPTVVVAAGFNALLGPRGWINLALMQLLDTNIPPVPFIGTLGAILVAHVFYNTTIVIRVVGNALEGLDPRLEQAARSLGARKARLWWSVTLPLLRPALLAAGSLVFLFDFTSFGVVLLLGGPGFATMEVEIYIQALQLLNLPMAGLLSLIQLLCTLVFAQLYTRAIVSSRRLFTSRARAYGQRQARSWSDRLFVFLIGSLLVIVFIFPMIALPLRSISRLEAARGERTDVEYGLTTRYYQEIFINQRDSLFYVPPIRAAVNSLGFAGLTVLLSLMLGYPAAYALAPPARMARWLDPFVMLPLGASTVTLGLGYILSFNHPPFQLLASPWLLPLAHTTIALPFVIRTLQPALASIPERLRQAAASLGAPPYQVWLAVDWPVLWRATLAAATFAFTISLGEFGAASLLARPEYPTIPVAIYRFLSQPGALNYGQAMAMATILMALTTVGILLIERVRPADADGL